MSTHGVQAHHHGCTPDGRRPLPARALDSRCDYLLPGGRGGDGRRILALYPDLEADDVREALFFAAEAVRGRTLPLAAGQ